MHIKFVEIRNFRKLKSVRIDVNDKTTLCVGANNSGKTSAMIALSTFLVHPSRLNANDFTLSDWTAIDAIGAQWEAAPPVVGEHGRVPTEWESFLPSLDVWLHVANHEVHFARDLLPSLDWSGGALGVRLRFEPKDLRELIKEYLAAVKAATTTKSAATESTGESGYAVTLWPGNLRGFLERKLHSHFTLRYYLLDPAQCSAPVHGVARVQPLPAGSEPLERNPLKGLVRIDEISAQRGLGESHGVDPDDGLGDTTSPHGQKKLSEQLRAYYARHLDPTEFPEPADLGALEAIEHAQREYDSRLAIGFSSALKELELLNYPGVTDPKLTIATRLRPSDGLNHNAAVLYEVCRTGPSATAANRTLPEEYNGLGYQNLISMVFKLMGFRDAWMRVGKAGRVLATEEASFFLPPLHLVLIEEPEAYLHAQVQQVFVKKAYDVLRNHPSLKTATSLTTQLIVSTHSSHIAHECEFACLRYFRRQPPSSIGEAPTSTVINLSEVFGPDEETPRFVTRYLRATHCDLFFADAAIIVEGPAERMLVPQFIRRHFETLHRRYVTVLDIGGSHAHRLRPLIETLGLITLIITDLDSAEKAGHHKATSPKRGQEQVSRNATLKSWHPANTSVDALLNLANELKVKVYPEMPLFAIRVAYQVPIAVKMSETVGPVEALATTFEDALVLENLDFFRSLPDHVTTREVVAAVAAATDPAALSSALFDIVGSLNKAAFALDLLWLKDSDSLRLPAYIADGLGWLEQQLTRADTTPVAVPSSAPVAPRTA